MNTAYYKSLSAIQYKDSFEFLRKSFQNGANIAQMYLDRKITIDTNKTNICYYVSSQKFPFDTQQYSNNDGILKPVISLKYDQNTGQIIYIKIKNEWKGLGIESDLLCYTIDNMRHENIEYTWIIASPNHHIRNYPEVKFCSPTLLFTVDRFYKMGFLSKYDMKHILANGITEYVDPYGNDIVSEGFRIKLITTG